MAERTTLETAGYILYSDMLDRLQQRFPGVAPWRVAQIVAAEYDAITGGLPRIVPVELETGATEMLLRQTDGHPQDGEVA